MPRASKKPKIDPDSLHVCWQSGSADIDGTTVQFTEGERLRGDHPAVQGYPWYFVPDGTPEGERPTFWTALRERTDAEAPPAEYELILTAAPVPLEREDVVKLVRGVAVGIGTGKDKQVHTYAMGTCFNARSEFANAAPDLFEPADLTFTRGK
jgi:hypothetical protein